MGVNSTVSDEEVEAACMANLSPLAEPSGTERRHMRVALEAAAKVRPAALDPQGPPLTIIYTNWRGETAERSIVPIRPWFGSTEWHPEPQWLLTAFDVEKQAARDFAWAGIDPQGKRRVAIWIAGRPPLSVMQEAVEAGPERQALIGRLTKSAALLRKHARKLQVGPGDNDYEDAAGRIDDAIAALSSPPSQPSFVAGEGWQPIGTAPRDGTWIWVWCNPAADPEHWANPLFVRWHTFGDGDAAWVWPDDVYEVYSERGREMADEAIARGVCGEDTKSFTYWRPLPTPPVPEQGGEG
jgi:hypothetical protein